MEPAPNHEVTEGQVTELVSRVFAVPPDPFSPDPSQRTTNRRDALKEALPVAEKAWLDGSLDIVTLLAEKIADGARDPDWREPLAESGLLDFWLSTVITAEGLPVSLKKQSLRLVGNACAACDKGGDRVVVLGKVGKLVEFLDDDNSLLPFAISVLYNICLCHEEAQHLCVSAGLSKRLVGIISGPRLLHCQGSMPFIIHLFEQLVRHDEEAKVADPTTPAAILTLAASNTLELDIDDFTSLFTIALAYLTYEVLQMGFVEADGLPVLQQAFYQSYTRFDLADADPGSVDDLKTAWSSACTILADISALTTFSAKYPLDSPVVQQLLHWLSTPPTYFHLQTAACLSLGNLGRSDEACTALIDHTIDPLVAILSRAVQLPNQPSTPVSDRPPFTLLYAVLGFLKNLAVAPFNKYPLSMRLLPAILPTLWTSTSANPQVQFATVSFTRLLLTSNPTGVSLVCAPISNPTTTTYTTRDGPPLSRLHILMDVALRADADPTKMEAARAVCATIKTFHLLLLPEWTWGSSNDTQAQTDTDTPRARFYSSHAEPMIKTLTGQFTHKKFASLRSEALFVLALLARSPDGGKLAMGVLESVEAYRVLVQMVTGRELTDEELGVEGEGRITEVVDGGSGEKEVEAAPAPNTELLEGLGLEPQQADVKQTVGMGAVDRENGMVLATEILRGFSSELSPGRRTVLETALKEGAGLLSASRNVK